MTKNVIQALTMPTFEKFDSIEVNSHNQIHNCMCVRTNTSEVTKEECRYSMNTIDFTSFDPLFFLHHGQVDRILALYQHIREVLGQQDWTKESFLQDYKNEEHYNFTKRPDISGSFDWPMSPFCNASMNPSYVTLNKGSWTIRNSYYYQELFGYKYDSFDLGGKSWLPLLEDIKKIYRSENYGHERPFVSGVAPELGVIYNTTHSFSDGCTTKYKPAKFKV
uniref:Tyrosinase copper-binding domain-containing protein n=1 Tax=Ciona savignyi TaxID=51511 RepID=H2ZF91_CIOSA